jgi:hypothetical protein
MKTASFSPASWTSVPLTAAAASAAVQLRATGNTNVLMACRVVNESANPASIAFGAAGVAATAGSYRILPNSVEVVRIPFDATHVAAISAAGATLSFTLGDGL